MKWTESAKLEWERSKQIYNADNEYNVMNKQNVWNVQFDWQTVKTSQQWCVHTLQTFLRMCNGIFKCHERHKKLRTTMPNRNEQMQ